jgi:hypothetical protein
VQGGRRQGRRAASRAGGARRHQLHPGVITMIFKVVLSSRLCGLPPGGGARRGARPDEMQALTLRQSGHRAHRRVHGHRRHGPLAPALHLNP